jgi:hypothetical protein
MPASNPALPLAADIDAVVRPTGGEPVITAPDLNGLLQRLATELAPAPPVPAAPPTVRVRAAFGPGQPITFDAPTDYEDAEGLPLTEGFDDQGSAAAFSYEGAVRGTTVRVAYLPARPLRLPPGFTLLGGGAWPAPGRSYVLHLRYVHPGVVDVLAGPDAATTPVGRFWAPPGQDGLGVGLYMGPDTRVLAVSSEGRQVRSGAFNNSGPGVHFDHPEQPNYFDVLAYAGSRTNGRVVGVFAGIGPLNGVLDLDTLPPLTENYALLQYSRGYTKVVAHQPELQLGLAFRYEGTPLDLGACVVRYLDLYSSYCTDVVLPPANDALTFFNLGEHRLYGKELIFPALPRLATLILSTGQHHAGRLEVLDITQLPGLVSLSTSQAALRTLVVGATRFDQLEELDFTMGRLTTRAEAFGHGGLPALLALLGRAPRLRFLQLSFNGLAEAELAQVAQALLDALPASTAPGPRQLILHNNPDESEVYANVPGYPYTYNNDPDFGFAWNAAVVTRATRALLASLEAGGWQVRANYAVPLQARYQPAGNTLQVSYAGPEPLEVWAVGDTLALRSLEPNKVAPGAYTVVAAAGATWQLAPAAGTPALAPFEGAVWVPATPPAA